MNTTFSHHSASSPGTESSTITVEQVLVQEQGNVYVHCYFSNGSFEGLIRIWRSTYLIDRVSGARAELMHAENISFAPSWTRMPPNKEYRFLLIFSGLPAGCVSFDLVEEIPEPGGFFVSGILRNEKDVYHVSLD